MEIPGRTKRRTIKAVVAEHIRLAEQDAKTAMELFNVTEDVDRCGQTEGVARLSPSLQGMTQSAQSDSFCRDFVNDSEADLCIDAEVGDAVESSNSTDEAAYDCASSETNECQSDNDHMSFIQQLAKWSTDFGITHAALNSLLVILNSIDIDVPRDARTLLATPKQTEIKCLAGGQYHHHGILNALNTAFRLFGTPVHTDTLTLHINIDGLPLFISTSVNVWPILGLVKEFPLKEPFIIGIYCGKSKPTSVDEFLNDFIQEMKSVLASGVVHNNILFKVRLAAIICDAPARSFIKCIKGHSGYSACERCTEYGVHVDGRVTFPNIRAPLRSDESFVAQSDYDHHTGLSPFLELGIGMVSCFPLDYMHLICLGVVKRIVKLWMSGPKRSKSALPACTVSSISDHLQIVRSSIPREFCRKPRPLADAKRWKATECRLFLLYTGPVVLRGKVPETVYDNFMMLSVAVRVLLDSNSSLQLFDYAEKLLRYFVDDFSSVYGEQHIVYNVHSLIHLADDARRYGALDNVSCFPYENYMQKIKRMIRKGQNPIAQIMRRSAEKQLCDPLSSSASISSASGVHKIPHCSGPLPREQLTCQQYKQYSSPSRFISCQEGDNCFMINDQCIVVQNILLTVSNETLIVYEFFKSKEPLFLTPANSLELGILTVWGKSDAVRVCGLADLCSKMILLPAKEKFAAIPILHSTM